jgi:DNA-binding beta-propeller fold protein YncE
MALSADGRRLYLAYDAVNSKRTEQKGVLDVIDTATGNLIAHVDNPNRWLAISELYDSTMALSQYDSTMALSKDGRWLFVYKTSTDGTFCGLAVFDTTANRFLPDRIALPKCETPLLIPSQRSGNTLFVVCEGTNDVRTARLTPNGKPVVNDIPRGFRFGRIGMVKTAFQSEDDLLRVVMSDGEYSNLDLATRSIVGRGALAGTPAKGDYGSEAGRLVRFSQASAGKVFLGLVGPDHRNRLLFDEIAIVKANTLERTATMQASAPLWAFAVGTGGSRLYGLDPRGGKIHVFDTTQAVETEVIEGVGKSPTIVILSQ